MNIVNIPNRSTLGSAVTNVRAVGVMESADEAGERDELDRSVWIVETMSSRSGGVRDLPKSGFIDEGGMDCVWMDRR